MVAITTCKSCKQIFKFHVISDEVPTLCPKCEKEMQKCLSQGQ